MKIATLESKLHKDEEHLKNVAGEVANEMNKFKNQLELSLNSTSISWNHFKVFNVIFKQKFIFAFYFSFYLFRASYDDMDLISF